MISGGLVAAESDIEIDECLHSCEAVLYLFELGGEQVFLCLEHLKVGAGAVVHQFASAYICLIEGGYHGGEVFHSLS